MGGHLRLVAYGACTLCLFTVCILGPEPWNSSMGLEWKMGSQQSPHFYNPTASHDAGAK